MSNTKKVNNVPFKTEAERKFHVLSQFLSNVGGNIYSIRGLPPEFVAALFAKYSRTSTPMKELLFEELEQLGVTKNMNKVYASAKIRDKMIHSERAREFHEKYTVGFGHDSITKMADGIAVAVDACSILAGSYMRGGTRAGFQCIERSTRYQEDFFNANRVVNPELIFAKAKDSPNFNNICTMYAAMTSAAINFSKGVYETLIDKLTEKFPYTEEEYAPHNITKAQFEGWIRNRALDNARFTIPVAAVTGMGIVANSMSYNHLMNKMFNHQSPELQAIAVEMNDAVSNECPVLTKDLALNPTAYRANSFIDHDLNRLRKHILDCIDPEDQKRLNGPTKIDDLCYISLEGRRVSGNDLVALLACVIISQHTMLPVDMVYTWFSDVLRNGTAAEELMKFSSYPDNLVLSDTDFALKVIRKMIGQYTMGNKVVDGRAAILKNAGPDPSDPTGKTRFEVIGYEKLSRVFELFDLTFDVMLDFGTWRDIQTHAFMTRIDYPLMPSSGFAYPEDIQYLTDSQREFYQTLFDMSASLWKMIIEEPTLGPSIAEYAALNMWYARKIIKINLRELDYLTQLRTRWQGHFSYRRIAQILYARTVEQWPILAQILKIDLNQYLIGRIAKFDAPKDVSDAENVEEKKDEPTSLS